jgi:ribose-phosphate pyrophosphokinase
MKLFSGTSNKQLAEGVVKKLNTQLARVEIVRFSDGEARVRIEDDVNGEEVVFLQSTSKPADKFFVETLFFIDSAKRLGAKEITLVMPYFGYARQDKAHRKGEAVSAAVLARCLEVIGAGKLITFDIHSKHVLSYFTIPTIHRSCLPFLVKDLIEREGLDTDNLGIFSPDQDGAFRARDVISEIEKGEYGFVQKERDLDKLHTLKAIHGQRFMGEPRGKDIILVDDMIASGGTIVEAVKILKEEGAGKIYVAATHPVFILDAPKKLQEIEIEKVYVTDSIEIPEENKFGKLHISSLASTIAGVIK